MSRPACSMDADSRLIGWTLSILIAFPCTITSIFRQRRDLLQINMLALHTGNPCLTRRKAVCFPTVSGFSLQSVPFWISIRLHDKSDWFCSQ